MYKYVYDGPVLAFGALLTDRWKGVTFAVSEQKARNNFKYQFNRRFGRTAGSKITLPGEIKCEKEDLVK